MSLLAILSFVVQLGLALHCIRTKRDKSWLYMILFLPGIGSILYVLTQMLPDLRGNPTARAAARSVSNALDPGAELRARIENLQGSDNVQNRLALADECMDAKLYAEAEELYSSALSGHDAGDPFIQLKLARALFAQELWAPARARLESLIESNPDFRSPEGHLLYARTLEVLNDHGVDEEYDALLETYPGEEARVRYGLYQRNQGDHARADALFAETVARAARAPGYYQKAQSEWVNIARNQLKESPVR